MINNDNPTVSIPSLDVLMNRGFRAVVHKVTQRAPGAPWEREVDVNGNEAEYEVMHIRFTNWTTACLEEEFGGMEQWQAQFEKQTFNTISKTIAIIEGKYTVGLNGANVPDTQYGAQRMKDNAVSDYSIAITNALMLSQGLSPELVGEAAEMAFKEMATERAKAEVEIRRSLNEAKSEDDTLTSPNLSLASESISEIG